MIPVGRIIKSFCQKSSFEISIPSHLNNKIFCCEYNPYLGLYSTTKYKIGQPPSFQAFKCSVTLPAETSRNDLATGTAGATPLVFVAKVSDLSPTPILKNKEENHHIFIVIISLLPSLEITFLPLY